MEKISKIEMSEILYGLNQGDVIHNALMNLHEDETFNREDRAIRCLLRWGWIEDRGFYVLTSKGYSER